MACSPISTHPIHGTSRCICATASRSWAGPSPAARRLSPPCCVSPRGDEEAMMLRGGCFCRAVRYEIDAEPTNQTICHCTMCRHAAGAPSVAWFSVPPDSVRFVAGEPQRFKSSEHATRSFCPQCGTTLTYQSTRTPGDLDVTTCSLDEPDHAAPRDHTFVRSKLSWMMLADDLPAYPTTRSAGE